MNSECDPTIEKCTRQALDLNGVSGWNGFRSFSILPAIARIDFRKGARYGTDGRDGSIRRERSTERAVGFDDRLDAQNLNGGPTLARHRAKPADQMNDSVLLAAAQVAACGAVPVKEVAPAPTFRQTPSKLEQRQTKMLAENTRALMPDRLTAEAKASAETDVLNPLEKHHTTHEIAAAWNVHPVTVYRDFVDEKGVVKLGSGSNKRRTRRELRIPESVLIRVYDKRRT